MDWAHILVFQVLFQPTLSVLFTVVAEQAAYRSEFGGAVVIGCRFQPVPADIHTGLHLSWHIIKPDSNPEVYVIENGKEDLQSQHPAFRGRVKLVAEELAKGRARIQVSNLKINDSGTYQCLVRTAEGADYKNIKLDVTAPYKKVTKRVQKAPEEGGVLLTCRAEGYPESPVEWEDAARRPLNSTGSSAATPDSLVDVSSRVRVAASERNNYTCRFLNGGVSATFHIPDDIPPSPTKNHALIATLVIFSIVLFVIVAAFIRRRCKARTNL